MYQDINIKNPIFLSSFIFIILSLLLLYRKQNYFAKVQTWNLQVDSVPKTSIFGTQIQHLEILCQNKPILAHILRSSPEKFLPGSTLPDVLFAQLSLPMPQCTVSYLSGRYSFVLRDIFYPSTCRGRKRVKSEICCKIFKKLLQKADFLTPPSYVEGGKSQNVKNIAVLHWNFTFGSIFNCKLAFGWKLLSNKELPAMYQSNM